MKMFELNNSAPNVYCKKREALIVERVSRIMTLHENVWSLRKPTDWHKISRLLALFNYLFSEPKFSQKTFDQSNFNNVYLSLQQSKK